MPEAHGIETPAPDPEARARTLIEQGIAEAESGHHESAITALDDAQRIANEAGSTRLVMAALINRGYAFGLIGEDEAATKAYTEAVACARRIGDIDRLELAQRNLAVQLAQSGRHAEAIEICDELLELLAADADAVASIQITRGHSLIEVGDYRSALEAFEAAERAADRSGDRVLVALARRNQGYAYSRDSDPTSAALLFRQAVELARGAGDDETLGIGLVSLGQEALVLGSYHEATQAFSEAEAIYRATEARDALADTLYWHGVALRRAGQAGAALDNWREEERIRRTGATGVDLADCLLAQADTLRERGDHGEAVPLFAEAEALYSEANALDALASTLHWHGASLQAADRPEEALDKWRAEEAVRRQTGLPAPLALCLTTQADLLRTMGDSVGANALYREAEDLYRDAQLTTALVGLLYRHATALRSADRASEALEKLDEAVAIATANGLFREECRINGLRSFVLADLGDTGAADQALDAAEFVCVREGFLNLMVRTLARRAYVRARDGQPSEVVVGALQDAHELAAGEGRAASSAEFLRSVANDVIAMDPDRYGDEVGVFVSELAPSSATGT